MTFHWVAVAIAQQMQLGGLATLVFGLLLVLMVLMALVICSCSRKKRKRHTWDSPYILLFILVISFKIDAFVECFLLFEYALDGPVGASAVGLPHVC